MSARTGTPAAVLPGTRREGPRRCGKALTHKEIPGIVRLPTSAACQAPAMLIAARCVMKSAAGYQRTGPQTSPLPAFSSHAERFFRRASCCSAAPSAPQVCTLNRCRFPFL